jgi:hypothetical protein
MILTVNVLALRAGVLESALYLSKGRKIAGAKRNV